MAVIARPEAGSPARHPRGRLDRGRRLSRLDQRVSPYLFVAPFFILFAIFGIYPLIWTAWISVHDTEFADMPSLGKNIGFENFTWLFQDDWFWNAVWITLVIGIISAVPQLLMALGLAHVLNYKLRGSTFWRISVLAPYVTSVAAATVIFAQLFNRDVGMVNWLLHTIFHVNPIDWKNEAWPSRIAISLIVIWRWTGYNALIYLAAMQSIPNELYESASIDGAGRWRQFRDVTIPSLRPTIIFTVIVSTIGSLQLFGEPYLFAPGGAQAYQGGASRQFQTLSLLFFERGFILGDLGRAAAIAWVMFLITLIFVLINTWVTRRIRDND
jgi:cellobiose transport system permease protein